MAVALLLANWSGLSVNAGTQPADIGEAVDGDDTAVIENLEFLESMDMLEADQDLVANMEEINALDPEGPQDTTYGQ